MQMASRILTGAGVAYNLALGFEPDRVEVWLYNATPDSIVRYHWFGHLAEEDAVIIAGGGIYGWSVDGAVIAELDADTGFKPYEGAKTPQVLVDSPKPAGGQVLKSVADWLAATDYSSGERSATAVGTIVRPPTHNGYVYELTTDTSTGDSEPTAGWTTTPGETSTDGGGNIWTCREENIANAGELGITLGATLMTDSNLLMVNAWKADKAEDLGDVA